MTPRRKTSQATTPARPRQPRTPAAKVAPAASPPEQRLRRVAELAYQRFLARGGAHGRALEDWLEAERQIEAEERQNR